MRGAREAVLEPRSRLRLIRLPLAHVGHGAPGAPAVHHLGGAVVGVGDEGPGNVVEKFAALQPADGLAGLERAGEGV